MAEQAKFLEGSLFRHVTVMSLTASVGLMAIFFVDLVDMIFISMLGNAALAAAVGYAGAILFFTSSFGIGMSIAAGAVVARALGEGQEDDARHKTTTALIISVLIGIVFAAIVWSFIDPLIALVGATGDTAKLASSYLSIILPSLPFLIAGMVGSAVLRAHGDASRSMWATIAGGIVNAVLDPLFIFGFAWGLEGAAWASVCARIAIAVVALMPIIRVYGGFVKPTFAMIREDAVPLAAIGFPAVLTQFATPIGSAFVTRAMAPYGADAVAGMAIIGRLTPVAFGTIFALSGAVGPIIGQNFGAKKFDRVRTAFREGLIFTALVVCLMTLVLYLFRGLLADLFNATGITRELVFLFCGPLALAFFFNGIIFVSNASFNNLGHPYYSTWINWGRQTLGTIPLVMICAGWFGAPGVLIGQAVGGVIFGLIAVVLAYRVIGEQDKEPRKKRHAFHKHARQHQLGHFRR